MRKHQSVTEQRSRERNSEASRKRAEASAILKVKDVKNGRDIPAHTHTHTDRRREKRKRDPEKTIALSTS